MTSSGIEPAFSAVLQLSVPTRAPIYSIVVLIISSGRYTTHGQKLYANHVFRQSMYVFANSLPNLLK